MARLRRGLGQLRLGQRSGRGQREEMYTVAEAGLKALAAQPWDFMPAATELLIRSDHLERGQELHHPDAAKGRRLRRSRPYLEGLVADKQGQLRDAVTDWRKAITLGYRQPAVRRCWPTPWPAWAMRSRRSASFASC